MDKLEEFLEKIQKSLEGLLKPIIAKLPLKKSKDDEDDEFEDEDTAVTDVSIKAKTQKDLNIDEEDEEGDEDSEDRLQQIRAMAPKIILGVVLLFLVVDQFFLTDDSKPQETVQRRKPKKRRKVQPKKVSKNKDLPTDSKSQKAKPNKVERVKIAEPAVKPKPVVKKVEPAPVKKVTVKKVETKPEPSKPLKSIKEASAVPPETPTEVLKDSNVKPVVEEPATTVVKESSKPMKNEVFKMKDEPSIPSKQQMKTSEEMTTNTEGPNSYVAPPNYQRFGRGLVYNCKGMHWACVDQYSYIKCNENNKWNKANGKKAECVIKNVYAKDEGCIKVQKYYIDNNEPTSFCGAAKAKN